MIQQTTIYTKVPTWLYDLILAASKKNRRSLAAEIGFALENKFAKKKVQP